MTVSPFPVLHYPVPHTQRRMAFSQVGDANSACVLLCLPGLLETRATFDPLLQAADGLHGLRVISVDHCGRGDSDPLPGDKGYSMQVYLEDLVHFVRHTLMPEGKPVPRIEVLGTSMGGLLAMYLAHDKQNQVSGLLLNDIGLSLQWLSIYGLYDSMKKEGRMPEPEELAEQLNVSLGAVMAVRMPTHFDLPYRKDWKGMQFAQLLSGFKGPVRLVHGSDSGVCLGAQVKELKNEFPKAQVLEVAGASHPVPFTAQVNQFVLQSLSLPATPQAKPQLVRKAEAAQPVPAPKAAPQPAPVTEPEPVPETVAEAVVKTVMPLYVAEAHHQPKPRVGVMSLIKQLLGATKK